MFFFEIPPKHDIWQPAMRISDDSGPKWCSSFRVYHKQTLWCDFGATLWNILFTEISSKPFTAADLKSVVKYWRCNAKWHYTVNGSVPCNSFLAILDQFWHMLLFAAIYKILKIWQLFRTFPEISGNFLVDCFSGNFPTLVIIDEARSCRYTCHINSLLH